MDKAALLGRVVNQLKDLKRKASETTELAIPSEFDEVTIDHDLDFGPRRRPGASKQSECIKASISCDNRPELYSELVRVLKGLRLVAIRADVSSVRGRIKTALILCSENGVCIDSLKHSLKVVPNKIACSSMASSSDHRRIRSKEAEVLLPCSSS